MFASIRHSIPNSETSFSRFISGKSYTFVNKAKTFVYAKQSVDKGLPIERFQVGPRNIVEPLYAHSEFNKWISIRKKQLLH